MYQFRALRLALTDLWDESLILVVSGVLGAILGFLFLPLPFVLAAHYGLARRVSERRVVSWRMLPALARMQPHFFVVWTVLVAFVTLVLVANVLFYLSIGAAWSRVLAWVMVGLLLTWLLPQPFIPALYLQDPERSPRVTLRQAAVFLVMNPGAVLILWLSVILLALPLAYFAWPLLGVLMPFMALVSTRMVQLYLRGSE